RNMLVEQITGRVRWRETVLKMGELGVDSLIEAGTGKVLSGLVRRINRDIKGTSLQTMADIEVFIKDMN
ncbi:MAG: ACP S-malonyltransferase, partial [Emcibacteraceae bacterium]|nr:ACP S-malonyltransferase [Emcibacteraceae bacterium]